MSLIIQGSVSLTDKLDTNYTIIVPKIYKYQKPQVTNIKRRSKEEIKRIVADRGGNRKAITKDAYYRLYLRETLVPNITEKILLKEDIDIADS